MMKKELPISVFLHGAGECGDDLDVDSRYGYAKYMREDGADYQFIWHGCNYSFVSM